MFANSNICNNVEIVLNCAERCLTSINNVLMSVQSNTIYKLYQ